MLPGPPQSLVDGAMYALPANAISRAEHGNGIEVTLCYRVEVYEELMRDQELMRFATALD